VFAPADRAQEPAGRGHPLSVSYFDPSHYKLRRCASDRVEGRAQDIARR
jgi:hypothetical protein